MSSEMYPFSQVSSGSLPTRVVDGGRAPARYSNYGDQYVQPALPWAHALSLEGSYFEFHNATFDASSTLAGHAAPVLVDIDATFTKAFIFLRNADASGSLKRLHLLWTEIEVITAGANGTDAMWADELDTGTTRYSSGGADLTVINPNMQSANSLASVLTAKGGAVVVSAEGASNRKLGFGHLRPSIEIAGDRKVFVYGDAAPPQANAAAAIRVDVVRRPPVILGPTDQYMLGLAAASQSVAGVYKVRGAVAYR